MRLLMVTVCALITATSATAQTARPTAVDITAADIGEFIDLLPEGRISDRPIRVADVGGYKVG